MVIVTLNLTTIRFALMHIALLGAAIGMVFGQPALPAAIAAIALGSFALGPISDRTKMDTGLWSALFMTGSIACAFILFHTAGISAMEAFGLFTGSILAMTPLEMWAIVVLGAVIVVTYIVFFREIQLVLYDRQLAAMLGLPAEAIRNGLLVLTGLAVGLAMRIVGALLIDSVILLPALGALIMGRDLKQVLVACSLIGICGTLGGLLLSMAVDIPSGASMTAVAVAILALSMLVKTVFSKIKAMR